MNAIAADAIAQFKHAQKETWANFSPMEIFTTPPAALLVKFARVHSGQKVLDVGCGTGVVAITAARLGAQVTAFDLTPPLLERARQNARLAEVNIEFHEGDAESVPFKDGQFDVVLSQFAHIFAPRPDVAIAEMLRVLKPGGTIAFSSWPPELYVGRSMALRAKYISSPPNGIAPPSLWGDPTVVRQRLGNAVIDLTFDRQCMRVPALSPQHFRMNLERTAGPLTQLIEELSAKDPESLRQFREDFDAIVSDYLEDNLVRQDYLMTRAVKA